MGSVLGRLVVDVMTNKSGGGVAYGDVVVIDTANDHSFTSTTTAGFTAGFVGVCIEPNGIASNSTGRIQISGYCPQVNAAASVTRGYFLKTHTVAKQATSSATRTVGAFGVALKTSATPDAILWGLPDAVGASGSVAGDPIWDLKGDLAVASAADTAGRLAVGANGKVLVADSAQSLGVKWADPPFVGCRSYNSGQQTINNNTVTSVTFDTDESDPFSLHSTLSNTSRFVADRDGFWELKCHGYWNAIPSGALFIGIFNKNGTIDQKGRVRGSIPAVSEWPAFEMSITVSLVATDYLVWQVFQNVGSSRDFGGGAAYETVAEFSFLGT